MRYKSKITKFIVRLICIRSRRLQSTSNNKQNYLIIVTGIELPKVLHGIQQ